MDKKYTKLDFEELINFDWPSFEHYCRVDDIGIWLLKRNSPVFEALGDEERELFVTHPDRDANMPALPFPFTVEEFLAFAMLPAFDLRGFYTFADNTIDMVSIERLERMHAPAWELARALVFGERPNRTSPEAKQGEIASADANSMVTASACDGAEPAKTGPLPLTTGDIAFCFAGLRWGTEEKWKKPLGDKPKWLAACIVIPAVRGVSETRWSPVCIGAALVRDGHAKPNSVRAKFQTQPLLKPWLDEWKTYEADNLSAD